MVKALFINQPSSGHLNTLLTIATYMKSQNHDVSFLVPGIDNYLKYIWRDLSSIPQKIKNCNIPVKTIKPEVTAIFDAFMLSRTYGYEELKTATRILTLGMSNYLNQLIKDINEIKPDIIIADFAFYSAYFAAEYFDIPCVVIFHSGLPFKGEIIPPFGSGLPIIENYKEFDKDNIIEQEKILMKKVDNVVSKVRKNFNLPKIEPDMLRNPYSKWLNLVTTHEFMEAPRNNLNRNTLYIGPCFANRQDNDKFPFSKLCEDKFKIFISLGTIVNNRPNVFIKLIKALSHSDFQLIISAGKSYNKLIKQNLPDNTLIFPSVPQVELLPKIDMLIGHGGNNTTNETLSNGKPLIILPVGGEQADNARRIEYLGVGLSSDIQNFTEKEIFEKVNEIKSNPVFKEKALEIMNAILETNGPKTAYECIIWLAKNKKPLNRPPNFPLTVTNNNLSELVRL